MHDGIGHMLHPPWASPLPPQAGTPPPSMVNERAVRILLECILVTKRKHGSYPSLSAAHHILKQYLYTLLREVFARSRGHFNDHKTIADSLDGTINSNDSPGTFSRNI